MMVSLIYFKTSNLNGTVVVANISFFLKQCDKRSKKYVIL